MQETISVIPHDTDAEAALLSCWFVWPVETAAAVRDIPPSDFYDPDHQAIAHAISTLMDQGVKPDAVTVLDQLRTEGAEVGMSKLADVASAQGTPGNLSRYGEIVSNLARRRELMALGSTIAELARDEHDPAAAVDQIQSLLRGITEATNRRVHLRSMDEVMDDYLNLLEERVEGEQLGLSTGWDELDLALGGMREGELIVVAARPRVGKSTFAGNLALNVALAGHRTLVVSMEMAEMELMDRFVSAQARVNLSRLRMGQLMPEDFARIGSGSRGLVESPLYILDNPGAGLADIRAAALREQTEFIIVDYLQLVQAEKAGTREREVAQVAEGLKQLARELGIPIVVPAQLNRNVEMRANQRPMLADLRESGAIEAAANVVLGLYRDELVNEIDPRRGVIEVIILKSRNTSTSTVELAYNADQQRIESFGLAQ